MKFPNCYLPARSHVWAIVRDSGGDSQDTAGQKYYIEQYCAHYQLHLDRIFEDAAVSGKGTAMAKRNEFLEMIELIKSSDRPIVAGILYWSTSRVARDQDVSQHYKSLMRMRGYSLINISYEIPTGPIGRLIENIFEYKDEQYLYDLSEDVKRGLKFVIELKDVNGDYLGLWPGKPPRCFDHVPYDIGLKRNDGAARLVGRLVPNPEMFNKGRLAFEMRAAGRTFREIEQVTGIMGGWGETYGGYKSLDGQYSKFFRNPLYKGELHRGGEVYANFVPAMVTEELWAAANAFHYHRPRRGESWPVGIKHSKDGTARCHLLSGLCFCGFCHAKLYAWTRRRPAAIYATRTEDYVRYYYICQAKRSISFKSCESKAIHAGRLEPAILDHILGVYLTPGHLAELVEQVNEMLNSVPELDLDISRKESDLKRLDNELQNLIDLAKATGAARVAEEYNRHQALYQQTKSRLERLMTQRRQLQPITVDEAIIYDALSDWTATLTAAEIRPKQVVLQTLIERIEVGKDLARVTYSFPLLALVPNCFPVLRLSQLIYDISF